MSWLLEKLLLGLIGCVITALLILGMTYCEGWALMLLWRWYVVPLGIQEIGHIHACGLSLMASLFVLGTGRKIKEPKEFAEKIGAILLATLFIVGAGHVFKGYMP